MSSVRRSSPYLRSHPVVLRTACDGRSAERGVCAFRGELCDNQGSRLPTAHHGRGARRSVELLKRISCRGPGQYALLLSSRWGRRAAGNWSSRTGSSAVLPHLSRPARLDTSATPTTSAGRVERTARSRREGRAAAVEKPDKQEVAARRGGTAGHPPMPPRRQTVRSPAARSKSSAAARVSRSTIRSTAAGRPRATGRLARTPPGRRWCARPARAWSGPAERARRIAEGSVSR